MHSAYNLTDDKMDFGKSEILEVAIPFKKHTDCTSNIIKVGKQNETVFPTDFNASMEKSVRKKNTFNEPVEMYFLPVFIHAHTYYTPLPMQSDLMNAGEHIFMTFSYV